MCINLYHSLRVNFYLSILDVVQAYKGIQKEKEALETSLSILTSSATSTVGVSDNQENDEINNESISSESSTRASASSLSGDVIDRQNQPVYNSEVFFIFNNNIPNIFLQIVSYRPKINMM